MVIERSSGPVLHHARDAFTKSSNRIFAELRCIIQTLQSLRDLHYKDVIIATDCTTAFEAVMKPSVWPRYCGLLHCIWMIRSSFDNCVFEEEQVGAHSIAREIAKSVTRDERFQSYLALKGPSWLHDRIAREMV